jgi:O-acetyl-ADP-ribose deacetylase (regulator of RNase III)
MDDRELRNHLESLVTYLVRERELHGEPAVDGATARRPFTSLSQNPGEPRTRDLWSEFRALVNTREPWPADQDFLDEQDLVLRALIEGSARVEGVCADGVTQANDPSVRTSPLDSAGRLCLWRGDITRLAADAIVNAANSQLLGCWIPGHHCIDNAIHTFAGVQLRIACAELMAALGQRAAGRRSDALDLGGQPVRTLAELGYEEPVGSAQITDAFNLPSRHVLHTVGPAVRAGVPSELQRKQLASCYRSCLDAAASAGDRSIAFCCISTGVFGFPAEPAARIAVATVQSWLFARDAQSHSKTDMTVIFNVFGEKDERIYRKLLEL